MSTISPFSHPVYVLAKPAGSRCNLGCTYCYYLEKRQLYPAVPDGTMSDAVLERFIKEYIQLQTTPEVLFTWHGGEPLMRPLSFFEKVLSLQRRYADGRHIDNALQTNATLIDERWARFLHDNGFLVGVSIDGPQHLHDAFRKTRRQGPTFRSVMRGIELLNRYGVEWNALATVNSANAGHSLDFYRFFKDIGCHYIQFTPVVERLMNHSDGRWLASPDEDDSPTLAPFSITPEQWGNFLCTIFDEWVRHDVGTTFVQLFDATLAGWVGVQPGVCTMAPVCGHAAAIEANGDVYVCDHYVFPQYRLGNIMQQPLASMLYGDAARRFGLAKRESLTPQCRQCDWLMACHGECPRLRFSRDINGNKGHNYLCRGYERFFSHAAPYMDFMKRQLQLQRPPSGVMQWIADGMKEYD